MQTSVCKILSLHRRKSAPLTLQRRFMLRFSFPTFSRPFALVSVFVLLYASLLFAMQKPNKSASRTPQPAMKKPLLVAHRGASGYAPEHTLAAYQLAIEQGADFVEQDLQITKDGHFVCLHDPEL